MNGLKQGNPDKPFCNSEGYTDLTAFQAEKNIRKEEQQINGRINKSIEAIRYISRLFGFEIKGRIVLVDIKTGKEYR